ncbi:MAG TPA: erythromycin esterase family protein [Flavobacterium sp.]|jgi:erythromycin esterase-like protein
MKYIVLPMVIVMILIMSFFDIAGTSDKEKIEIPSHELRDEKDLDALIDRIGDRRVVLLGEASHGTSEYYEWRAAISKRLIEEKGFTIIGIEGEWADSYRVNQFIRSSGGDPVSVLQNYDRWPTWMWANEEVERLVGWLQNHNSSVANEQKVGFYGLDVYCLWESMEVLMPYIKDDKELTQLAQQVKNCFQPYSADPMMYAYAVMDADASCKQNLAKLQSAVSKRLAGKTQLTEEEVLIQQNVQVAVNGERYYSAAGSSSAMSWNIRDRHMMETIKRLLTWKGPQAKILIWEHNTHVGDARYTDMAGAGMVNVGQLVREEYGEDQVYIVGFGSYKGSVIASDRWGGKVTKMKVPAAKRNSWEELLHRDGAANKLVFSDELGGMTMLTKSIGHRAIGVQYDPNYESGNYVPTVVTKRYDAFVYIDETTALHPLPLRVRNEPPDTYPSGF